MMKKVLMISAAAAMAIICLTGCGERVEEVVTEVVTDVPVITEAVTEVQIETQPVTEIVTEPPTQPPTETEPPTEPDVDLPPEEEMAREEALAAPVTYYASDDANVRETPSTENFDNVICAYMQGDEVTVIAKTPHWYKVSTVDNETGGEVTGYVYKKFVSETSVEPKTDEEMAAAGMETAVEPQEQAAPAEEAAAPAPAPAPASGNAVTVTSDANIRADASEVADVVGTVNAGTAVTVIGEAGEWYQVQAGDVTGYINRNLVG